VEAGGFGRREGVLRVEGRMVERLHLEPARRVLAVADGINS
jgi:citrate lyase beta subunit